MSTFIPLARPLHLGLKGKDVTAVQLALRSAGFRHHQPTGKYGKATKHQVGEFKTKHGITKEIGYEVKTHKALWPSFGPVAHTLYQEAYNNIHKVTIIQKVVNVALYGVQERAVIHYTQDGRRMTDFAPPPNVPNWTDCSGFATWCYKSAGAPDPNGFGYNGYGFTGTMLLHGSEIPVSLLQKADLVFYGNPVEHVAIYVGNNRVVSHGSEEGPLLLDMGYRTDVSQARRYI